MVPQLAREFTAVSGRRMSRQTVDRHFAETGLYLRYPVLCVSNRKTIYLKAENINRGYHENGGVFLSVMSQGFLDKEILIEFSSSEKIKMTLIFPR
ncbi:hypothetical protein TNCV_2562701 [Trichonephila clavipes]|uniref:Uncharacterized protein n=1 Tax=Trichonephila clavipes TaxID=2585209 RepID=A0A8X6R121_TRICX|nr:hypothetical protein TNCV_2562701 [Trichonephila clavipes]